MSESTARNPLAKQGVDDHVTRAFLQQHVLFGQGGERLLNRRWSTEPVTRPCIGGVNLTTSLQHDRAQRRALLQRQPLPERFEDRLLFGQQPRQRPVKILERRLPRSLRAHIVPRFMREALDVVGQVASELDDRVRHASFRFHPRLDETLAARKPVLVYKEPEQAEAAE